MLYLPRTEIKLCPDLKILPTIVPNNRVTQITLLNHSPAKLEESSPQASTMSQISTNSKLIPLDLERRLPNFVTVFDAFNRLEALFQELVSFERRQTYRTHRTEQDLIEYVRKTHWIDTDERHIFIQNLQICQQLDIDEGFAPRYKCYPYAPGTLNNYLIRTPAVYRASGKRVPADLEPRRDRTPSPPVDFDEHEDLGFRGLKSDCDARHMSTLGAFAPPPNCFVCRQLKGPEGEPVGI